MEDNNNRLFFRGLAVGLLIGLAFILGFLGVRGIMIKKNAQSVISEDTEEKIGVLKGLINTYYYKDVDEQKLSDGILKGLVEGLDDPYSAYYTKEEYDQYKIDVTGNYAGIGAVLSQNADNNLVYIVRMYPDSPAEKAGLMEGDIIVTADGYVGASMELSDFVEHVRGAEGSTVKLEISREGNRMTYDVKREPIDVPSVSHRMITDEIGYIGISEFNESTPKGFEDAIKDLKGQGMRAVIYDVRSNTGGLVDSVTEMLDYILPEGTTVYMMDHDGNKTTYSSDEETKEELPTVVLINGSTASSSEIFAGAIRDFDYGTLIGTKSYGKGVVQNTIPLMDGSALKLTIASYYTPDGDSIQEKGIEPDIEIEYEYTGEGSGDDYEYDKDSQVTKAIEILKKELK